MTRMDLELIAKTMRDVKSHLIVTLELTLEHGEAIRCHMDTQVNMMAALVHSMTACIRNMNATFWIIMTEENMTGESGKNRKK